MDWLNDIIKWAKELWEKWNPKPNPPAPVYGAEEGPNNFTHPAKAVDSFKITRLTRDHVWFDAGPREGWSHFPGEPDWQGEIWCCVLRDGKWLMGKFDHVRGMKTSNPTTDKELKHMYYHDEANPAYGDWKTIGGPKPGERVGFFIFEYGHQIRTECSFGVLP